MGGNNMKNIINIILLLLVTLTSAEVRENIQDIVKEMVAVEMRETNAKIVSLGQEMKARVDTFEKDMKNMKSKHDLLEREGKIKDDMMKDMKDMFERKMTVKDDKFDKKVKDMNDTFEKNMKDMNDTFLKELKTKDDSIKKLMNEMSLLKDSPYTFFCAYRDGTDITTAAITYSKLLYSSTNIPDDATMDIETGMFTSGWGGTYTVTWSLFAEDGQGDQRVNIFLRQNGEIINESRHASHYFGPSGFITDQGGRTLVLRLERGDTLDLWCEDCSAGVYWVTFCVTLSSFD